MRKLYVETVDKLKTGQILHGFWKRDYLNNDLTLQTGADPNAMEGVKACTIGDNCYIFGGLSHKLHCELRSFNTKNKKWTLHSPDYK